MIRFKTFEELGVAVAAFSEKSDGDCGLATAHDPSLALRARQKSCAACGVDARDLVCARQVHGATVACATDKDRGRGATDWATAFASTDGLLTGVRGLPLAILVADCVPIYLFDPKRRAGGLVHAGRRGTTDNVCDQAVAVLVREFQSAPRDIYALIGPSAGPCCYEVSPDVADAFADAGLPTAGRNLNLWQANALRLEAAGLPPEQITHTTLCTMCDGRFHSYRADPKAGRNMALLVL